MARFLNTQQMAFCSLLAISLSANAADTASQGSKPAEENTQAPALNNESDTKVFMASQMKNSNRLFATGEVLFLKAHEEDLSYAVKSSSTSQVKDGHTIRPETEWDWGFRVGFGYNIPHDKWDIAMNYMQFQTDAHKNESVEDGEALFPSWQGPSGSGYATSADATWRLFLNMADVELGRAVGIAKWLSLRPFIGVRSAWIYQKYDIEYKGGTTVAAGDEDEILMRNNFWGIGGRFGVDSLWGLGKGFSIFGDGAFSLLSGFFHVHQREEFEASGTTTLNIVSHPNNVVTILDLSLGFQYDAFFSKNRYHLGVKLGYEFNYFFDQNQFMQFMNSSPGSINHTNGDLSLMGVSLGFRFDF